MITLDILSGDDKTCRRDVVVLNAALALYVSEKVDTIASGISLATILIDSGRAMVQFMKMRGDICDDINEIVDYKEQLLKDGYYHDKLQNLKG